MRIDRIVTLGVVAWALAGCGAGAGSAGSVADLRDEQALREMFLADDAKVRLVALLSPN